MRAKFQRVLLRISVIFSLITLAYLGVFEGYKDVTMGRIHREAFDLFRDTDDVYEVRIYLLNGDGASNGTFPVSANHENVPTYGSAILNEDDSKALRGFLDLWGKQEVNCGLGAMCHGPVYGFRLYRRGRLTRETTICWACHNFSVNAYPGLSTTYGFNSESEEAKALLGYCDKLLPYKK